MVFRGPFKLGGNHKNRQAEKTFSLPVDSILLRNTFQVASTSLYKHEKQVSPTPFSILKGSLKKTFSLPFDITLHGKCCPCMGNAAPAWEMLPSIDYKTVLMIFHAIKPNNPILITLNQKLCRFWIRNNSAISCLSKVRS